MNKFIKEYMDKPIPYEIIKEVKDGKESKKKNTREKV